MVPAQSANSSKWPIAPCLHTVSAQFKFHQKGVHYTVMLFWKGPVASTVDSQQSYIDNVSLCLCGWNGPLGLVCYKTSELLWVRGDHFLHTLSYTDSLYGTPKLNVNSSYWHHLERPFTLVVSLPTWTWWQTEILMKSLSFFELRGF